MRRQHHTPKPISPTSVNALMIIPTRHITGSKPTAARWALQTLDGRWAELIDRAVAWPQEPQPESLSETLKFIRYTIDRAQQLAHGW